MVATEVEPMYISTATSSSFRSVSVILTLATSIEELIAEAGITKSGFFYHFKDKKDLALGLLERHARQTDRLFESTFGRAAELSEDPLQAFLIGLTLLSEQMALLPGLAWTSCLALRAQQHSVELERVRAERRLQPGEIQHRVRNVLALVRSIASRMTVKASSNLDTRWS